MPQRAASCCPAALRRNAHHQQVLQQHNQHLTTPSTLNHCPSALSQRASAPSVIMCLTSLRLLLANTTGDVLLTSITHCTTTWLDPNHIHIRPLTHLPQPCPSLTLLISRRRCCRCNSTHAEWRVVYICPRICGLYQRALLSFCVVFCMCEPILRCSGCGSRRSI